MTAALRVVDSLFDALAAPHGLDRYLELVNPTLTLREPRGRIVGVRRTSSGSVTLTIRPNRHWRGFSAGQFVQLTVEIDGVRRTRCYSPITSEHGPSGTFEITVTAHPDGLVSQYLHAHAAIGTVVWLSQAAGEFRLPTPRPERVLLVSGGSGITPVLSMLRTLLDEGYPGELSFLHYAPCAADVAHLAELRECFSARPDWRLALSYTAAAGGDLAGHFTAEHLATVAPWYGRAHTFLCGPGGLMNAVQDHYAEREPTAQLHFEDFAPAVALPQLGEVTGEVTGEVRYLESGTSAPNDGRTLLDQAEAAGLNPSFGCRRGICFSCTTVKKSGCTRNLLTGDSSTEEGAEVQLCISVPVGDVALEL